MTHLFEYDGYLADGRTPAQGQLRCAVHDELGLLWRTPDVVRAVGLDSQNSSQLVDYAPTHTVVLNDDESRNTTARYTSHPVVMHWLVNRPQHHDLRGQMDRWAQIRKFPIAATPGGMPDPRASALKALANGAPDDDRTLEQKHRDRFDWEYLLCDLPVNVYFMTQSRAKPNDLEPWVSWVDACTFLPAKYGMRPTSQIARLQEWFKLGSEHVDRVRGKNGDFVIVISLHLFENLCRTYCERTAYLELIASPTGGEAKIHQWRREATKRGNARKELEKTQRLDPRRTAPPRRSEYLSARKTPESLQTQDWNPNSYESKKVQQRARTEAEENAFREMGNAGEMWENIKPE